MKHLVLFAACLMAIFLSGGQYLHAAPVMHALTVREEFLPVPPKTAEVRAIRDPFNWPPIQARRFSEVDSREAAYRLARIKLDGIIYSPDRPLALVSGRVLSRGKRIEGYTVKKITRQEVTLVRGRIVKRIRLTPPSLRIKQTGTKK